MRRLTEVVSESFIWGVGITHPKPGQERRAALYITATLGRSSPWWERSFFSWADSEESGIAFSGVRDVC